MNPLSVAKVVECYRRGMITARESASRLLRGIDPESIDFEMTLIPDAVMPVFRELTIGYRHGEMILFGFSDEPTKAQVAVVRDWFARHPVEKPVLEAVSLG